MSADRPVQIENYFCIQNKYNLEILLSQEKITKSLRNRV